MKTEYQIVVDTKNGVLESEDGLAKANCTYTKTFSVTKRKIMHQIQIDFIKEVNEINGLYLDTINGYKAKVREIDRAKIQLKTIYKSQDKEFNEEAFEKGDFKYRDNSVDVIVDKFSHKTSMKNLRERTEEGGENYVKIANLCLAQIYQLWEDKYRNRIADHTGISRDNLKSDIFGDIRYMRISIIHHHGIALKEIEKNKVFKWFKEGELIYLNPDIFQEIIESTTNEIKTLIKKIKPVGNNS